MEPAGLAVGVVGLAGVFSTCMECLEYIQMARSFGEDFGSCLLRLDVAKLRMSRWGVAVGLASGSKHRTPVAMSDYERMVAQNLFEEIMSTFENAESLSSRYKKRMDMQQSQTTDLDVLNPANDLAKDYSSLHRSIRQVAMKRQKQTSLLRKTQWALYEKRAFTNMIDSITGLVNDLIELFPAAKDEQVALCQEEVRAICSNTEGLQIMNSVTEENDIMLQAALQQELAQRDHAINDFVAEGGRFRVGDNNEWGRQGRAISSRGAVIRGTANVWLGNNNLAQPSKISPSSSEKPESNSN